MRTIVTALLVSAALTAASAAQVSEPFSRTLPLTADGSFSIDNVNGSILIETWDRNEVEITALRKAADADMLERVRIEVEASPTRVDVSTEMKGRMRNAKVDYRVRVPQRAQLHAEAVNGPIRILNPAGKVAAESVNGGIEIGNAAGPVSADSVNGPVEVSYVSLAAGSHEYEAVNGRLVLHMPSAAAGQFRASTVNGHIKSDFPLEVRKAKYGPQRSLSGTLGQGGADVSLQTVNGPIELLAGGEEVASRIRYHLDQPLQ